MNCKKWSVGQRQVSGTHLITAAKRKENGKEWRQLKELKGHIEQNNIYIKGIPRRERGMNIMRHLKVIMMIKASNPIAL